MKKIWCLALAACLGITMTAPSYGAESDGKGLEQAILTVKQVVSIPEEYKEFSYYTYDQETDWGSGTVWNLNWTVKEGKAAIYALVDWKGNLLYFEHYQNSDDSGLAKVTREQAAVTAKAFLQKAAPDLASNMKEVNQENSLQDNYRHVFQYKYHAGDIPVSFVNIYVRVNKYTGAIESYSGVDAGFSLPDLPAAEGLIGTDKAKEAFLKEIGLKLVYQSYYAYKEKSLTIFPAYIIGNSSKAVDARTGEVVNLFYSRARYVGGGGAMMDAAAEQKSIDRQSLTKEELEAVEKLGKLLSKEEAAEKILGQMPMNPDTKDITRASLRRDYMDEDKYIWELNFEEFYGAVDARTGELLNYSYNDYEDSKAGKKDLTEGEAKKIAESFLQKVAAEKFSKSVYVPDYNGYAIYPSDEKPASYSFQYNRLVNGAEFVDNGLIITVNRTTGNITYYSNSWFDKGTFPALEKTITNVQMLETMMKEYSFGTAYERTGEKGKSGLVYLFEETARTALFDPFTGQRISENGKPFESAKRPEYTDIKGHWSEKIVKELMANGYYLKGDLFNPDKAITQVDFFRYLFVPENRHYEDEDLYEMLVNRKILKENEKAPGTPLTRQDAAKFLVRYLGLGLAGEHSEIYADKFKDKVEDQYKGYATLCYGLGIMRGDAKGRFVGTKIMTNGEAAAAIYNALKIKIK